MPTALSTPTRSGGAKGRDTTRQLLVCSDLIGPRRPLLQTNNPNIAVRPAVPNLANGRITIYFTGAAPATTKVARFVFG